MFFIQKEQIIKVFKPFLFQRNNHIFYPRQPDEYDVETIVPPNFGLDTTIEEINQHGKSTPLLEEKTTNHFLVC